MANLAGKYGEMKLWGRGGNAIRHRSPSCKGRQIAHRDWNRAERKAAKQALARYADEIVFALPMGEDADAHVQAFDAWIDERYYFGGEDADAHEGCGCGLCLADNGIVGSASGLSIYLAVGRPCDFGLTPELLGYYAPEE